MLLIWSSLFFSLFDIKSALFFRALPSEPSISNRKSENTCDEYVDLSSNSKNPLIYKKNNIKKGTVICINASSIYMSIIFHSWENFEAKTLRIDTTHKRSLERSKSLFGTSFDKNPQKNKLFYHSKHNHSQNPELKDEINEASLIVDGPYKEKNSDIIGFYFGRHLGQVQLKALKNNAMLSFGSIVFHEKSTLRIISNSRQDTLKFSEPNNSKSHNICHRHIQYFNGLPGSQSYNIEMNIDENEDYLNFRNSRKSSMNFTGELSIQKKTTEEEPQTLNIFTHKNQNANFTEPINNTTKEKKLEVYLEIDETYNSAKSKKFGRLWTSSFKYATIPAFSYSEYSTGKIILIVVFAIFAIVIIAIIIAFIIYMKRKSSFAKCNDTCEEGVISNEDNDSEGKMPKKNRRMFFGSILGFLHAPKKNKNQPQSDPSQKKDDDSVKISHTNLLEQEC